MEQPISTNENAASLRKHFGQLPDPRIDRQKLHDLFDIVVITICAVICDADGWTEVVAFGKAHEAWFKTFLELPNGIASHDTFGRVFSLLDTQQLQTCFVSWVGEMARLKVGSVVAIDGKKLRGSCGPGDRKAGKQAVEMVSAWASEAGLVLGQMRVEEGTNEIGTVPELLKVLALRGCIVTVDAANCQTENAKRIVEQAGDYVFALKGNQGTLHDQVQQMFAHESQTQFKHVQHSTCEEVDKRDGHVETRRYTLVHDADYLHYFNPDERWWQLAGVGRVERVWRDATGALKHESRFFITSLSHGDVKLFAKAVRHHWHIENQLHWCLDIAFREDECRIREGCAAENLAVLRHVALNLLKQDTSVKMGIKSKRKLAGWDNDYLLRLITNLF